MESYSTKSNSFAVKVGIPELLNGIGNGEESHVADKVARFRDHEGNFVHTEKYVFDPVEETSSSEEKGKHIAKHGEGYNSKKKGDKKDDEYEDSDAELLMRMLSSLILSFTRERRKRVFAWTLFTRRLLLKTILRLSGLCQSLSF
ncbi:uncharacterized protein LOC133720116 [Rosa rugosa]|uniref:uncharacterized protein LOC133720116 n=1 Tax=Rosa rugosa TaxID=74645 RepID=UPI002B40DA42|nr:uncharacterized protein LOC133720116 [Rosa rugosa]